MPKIRNQVQLSYLYTKKRKDCLGGEDIDVMSDKCVGALAGFFVFNLFFFFLKKKMQRTLRYSWLPITSYLKIKSFCANNRWNSIISTKELCM